MADEHTDDAEKNSLTNPILTDDVYIQPWPWTAYTLRETLRFIFKDKDQSKIPSSLVELNNALPVFRPDFDTFATSPSSGIRVMWIGHATVLVQFDDITILTDPIFSNRVGPSKLKRIGMGAKRYRHVPCKVGDLPKIDAVVISHNHFDHLDEWSVMELNRVFGNTLKWFVPKGVAEFMHECGCTNVEELSWWESGTVLDKHGLRFVCTPSHHWSRRGFKDRNKTLWCSWSVIGPKHRFFFGGDSSYCPGFTEIGREYGPFDLAAIPIGGYEPDWIMRSQHMNPADAVQVHQDIKSQHSLGIHWGTFKLTYEPYLEPPEKVKEEMEKNHLPSDHFFTLHHGEARIVETKTVNE